MNHAAVQPAQIDVSPLSLSQVSQIMPIEEEVYPFPWSAGNFRDSLKAGYDAWLLSPQLHAPGTAPVIGYAIVMHALDEAHLLNLSIAKAFQGVGYGRRFLFWLMRSARIAGSGGMFLEVRPSNQPAIALYEQSGFLRVGRRPGYYPAFDGQREDAVVMRRSLLDLGDPATVINRSL